MVIPTQTHENSGGEHTALIDAHVHLYDCFDRTLFFDAALKNFQRASQSLGLPDNTPGFLMLTETSKDHAFASLIEQRELDGGRWRFNPAGDNLSLTAALEGRGVLTVIAGRQIVTREGLEVLALCCNETFNDGLAIEQTIENVVLADGLAVLPYGVGKWSGARGGVVDALLSGPWSDRLMLGDNAGRLGLLGEPKRLARARQKGARVLPGTDPLPLGSQTTRAGRYGMLLDVAMDREKPGASIKRCIQATQKQPITFGRTAGPFGFLKCQIAMQLRKRLRQP